MNSRTAIKLKKDSFKIRSLSEQLLKMARVELSKKSIDSNDYTKFIDLLTCLNLKTEEINFELTDYVYERTKRRINSNFDIKA